MPLYFPPIFFWGKQLIIHYDNYFLLACTSILNILIDGRFIKLGEKREGLLAVTIPERQGAFFEFCNLIGGRAVTEFNYRYNDDEQANIFVGVRLLEGQTELDSIIADLQQGAVAAHDQCQGCGKLVRLAVLVFHEGVRQRHLTHVQNHFMIAGVARPAGEFVIHEPVFPPC